MIRWVYQGSKFLALATLRLFFRYRHEGGGNVPLKGPVIAVANHASFMDPPLLGCAMPRAVTFVMRESLLKIPVFGWWCRAVGTIPIDRDNPGRGAFDAALKGLSAGGLVCMFPEGTRTGDGRILPFKRGFQLLVRKSKATVLPVGIEGSFQAWPRHRKLPRPRRCTVRIGAPMPPEAILAEDGMERLREVIAKLSRQQLAPASPEGVAGSDTLINGHSAVVAGPETGTSGCQTEPTGPLDRLESHSHLSPEGPATGRP